MNMKDKLRLCLEQIEGMSQTQFDSIIDNKAIDEVNYDTSKYENNNFHIIFDKEDINTSRGIENYMKSINEFKCANILGCWNNEMEVLSDVNYDFQLVEGKNIDIDVYSPLNINIKINMIERYTTNKEKLYSTSWNSINYINNKLEENTDNIYNENDDFFKAA
ncbi:UNVERIFIED_ORG: hypothetical protein B2H93_13930 [Clostridium botulinum]